MKEYILSLMTDARQGLVPSIIKFLLWLLSLGYGALTRLVCRLHELNIISTYKAPLPVISIGNITTGGAGKTPLTIWLTRQVQSKGLRPVILTRGYMTKQGASSDEAYMMSQVLRDVPLLIGADRVSNIKKAMETNSADVFICDDAFQHWKLKRDLNIVAIDSRNPFGNGHLLPRGILREPLSALARADIFVLSKIEDQSKVDMISKKLLNHNPRALVVQSQYKLKEFVNVSDGRVQTLESFKGKQVVAACGIADPSSFKKSLSKVPVIFKHSFEFMDHHSYTHTDIQQIVDYCRKKNIRTCVTTHKDAVKIKEFKTFFAEIEFVYLCIEMDIIKGQDEFLQRVMACCRR